MDIFGKLFGGKNQVRIDDLRAALDEVEKDRRRLRRQILRWERKRKQVVERMKKMRAEGNHLEVDYLWEELKEHQRQGTDLRREGRGRNLEGTVLRRYIHALERLQRKNDRASASKLLERIRASSLGERLSLSREAEVRYLGEVDEILREFDAEETTEQEDPEKALFLAELDRIKRAEDEGDVEGANDRQTELYEQLDEKVEGER